MIITILYLIFLLILGFIAAYMWLNKQHLLGLNTQDSLRLTRWAVPFLIIDIVFTGVMLWWRGPESFMPMLGLMTGGLVLPVIGLIIVQRNFD
ncbi:uncharacterized BrkB/YihY/UPF0761 family membrane protein [Weissella uvarum]|uniref:hypothetical protein n=1 Tax=Weissella uvarum TaxID=1479233 RepID=UPI001961C2E1|nr:hypothetical protein [Weissella uvarum]MBM7616507.1 uncharacterized BrkB/YihY/UPF0761 family membrane protein [Weissella uvarum]MCM0595032.1 hypothetical protein [Weissella uvarum]